MKQKIYPFLKSLQKNNNRPWFQAHKDEFEATKAEADVLFHSLDKELQKLDEFQDLKIYRIYRDIRFSKDKTPYKNHFSAIYKRKQPENRGSFYVHLEPENSFIAGGFWSPERDDLNRIRKAIAIERDLEEIISDENFKKAFGELKGEKLKNIPRDFEKNHPRAELLKLKQFLILKNFTDEQVLREDFIENVLSDYRLMQPFFRYMTEVLTTNENGESLLI